MNNKDVIHFFCGYPCEQPDSNQGISYRSLLQENPHALLTHFKTIRYLHSILLSPVYVFDFIH